MTLKSKIKARAKLIRANLQKQAITSRENKEAIRKAALEQRQKSSIAFVREREKIKFETKIKRLKSREAERKTLKKETIDFLTKAGRRLADKPVSAKKVKRKKVTKRKTRKKSKKKSARRTITFRI